jgi:hypothetical protein
MSSNTSSTSTTTGGTAVRSSRKNSILSKSTERGRRAQSRSGAPASRISDPTQPGALAFGKTASISTASGALDSGRAISTPLAWLPTTLPRQRKPFQPAVLVPMAQSHKTNIATPRLFSNGGPSPCPARADPTLNPPLHRPALPLPPTPFAPPRDRSTAAPRSRSDPAPPLESSAAPSRAAPLAKSHRYRSPPPRQ